MKKPTRRQIEALLQEDVTGDDLVRGLTALGFRVQRAVGPELELPLDEGVWVLPQDGSDEQGRGLVLSDRGAGTPWTLKGRGVAQTARDLFGWWASGTKRGTAKGANRESVLGALALAAKRGEALTREEIARDTGLDPVSVSNVLYQNRDAVMQDTRTGLYVPKGWRVRVVVDVSDAGAT